MNEKMLELKEKYGFDYLFGADEKYFGIFEDPKVSDFSCLYVSRIGREKTEINISVFGDGVKVTEVTFIKSPEGRYSYYANMRSKSTETKHSEVAYFDASEFNLGLFITALLSDRGFDVECDKHSTFRQLVFYRKEMIS